MINLENIDGVLVSKEIVKTKFTCDLDACKGACCTMESEFGAPLKTKEIDKIESLLPQISDFLSEESIKEIEGNGFWEKKDDELMTRSIDNKDCVFVYYENDIAKCAIRISDFWGDVIRYEKYGDCEPALEKGEKTGLSILEFCEKPIKRAYNKNFYDKLEKLNGK